MNAYGFIGVFKAQGGKRDELIAILLTAAKTVSAAKGCRQYMISKETKDVNAIVVSEIWDAKEDHDNALKMEGSAELIARAMPLMDGRPESRVLDIVGGRLPGNG